MSTEQPSQEPSRSTIVSRSPGLAYERMRETRQSHFPQSLVHKLTVQGGLLALLALSLVMVLVRGGGSVGSTGANVAFLAAAGGALVAAGATAHAGVGLYRLHAEPLTERGALAIITVEDAAAYLGIACGGLLVVATAAVVSLGLADGGSPAAGVNTAMAGIASGATIAATVALTVGFYLRDRLPQESAATTAQNPSHE